MSYLELLRIIREIKSFVRERVSISLKFVQRSTLDKVHKKSEKPKNLS